MKKIILLILISLPLISLCQRKALPKIEMLQSGVNTSLRGLSVVNNNVIWVSGSNGTVGKSTNGGKNFKWMTVSGFEKTDFRDIEAFDASTAIIMGIGQPAYILKTTDGGDSWKVVYENKTDGMFLDAMDFRDVRNGIVVGDPINKRLFIARTADGGNTWTELEESKRPFADSGEAFFAASGTNVRFLYNQSVVMITGGLNSRLFYDFIPNNTEMTKGKQAAGGFSVAVYDNFKNTKANKLVITGGDYENETATDNNCFLSINAGKSWSRPKTPPHGYRSSVEFLNRETLVTCGPTGVDYSFDSGKNFFLISKEGFHVCRFARMGNAVFLAGANGTVGKLVWGE